MGQQERCFWKGGGRAVFEDIKDGIDDVGGCALQTEISSGDSIVRINVILKYIHIDNNWR